MGVRKEKLDDGRIILRTEGGKNNGKLAGQVAAPAGAPTPAPIASAKLTPSRTPSRVSASPAVIDADATIAEQYPGDDPALNELRSRALWTVRSTLYRAGADRETSRFYKHVARQVAYLEAGGRPEYQAKWMPRDPANPESDGWALVDLPVPHLQETAHFRLGVGSAEEVDRRAAAYVALNGAQWVTMEREDWDARQERDAAIAQKMRRKAA